MKSKGYLRFKNRIHFFSVDQELIDILKTNSELLAGGDRLFLNVTKKRHPHLYNHISTPETRVKVIHHLRNTLYVSYIKDLYEEVTEYLRYILFHGAKAAPNKTRLVGEHNATFKANEVLSARDHNAVIKMVIDNIFQSLENEKSSIDLITKIKNKLDLTIDPILIEEALPYLLIRHIFVHTDGKPSAEFQSQYPKIAYKNSKGRILLSKTLLNKARKKVDGLIKAFDNEMISKGYFPPDELQS